MAVTHVAYEVDGWGVGELWLEGGRVVWHELPVPAGPTAERQAGTCELVERLRAYFAGADVSFDDVDVDLEYETPFLERCAHALRAVPRGEVVTYGELAALAGAPGAARAAGSSARATGSGSSCRATASSARAASARTARSASTTSAGCWSSRVSLSEDLRDELAQIAPDADCDRLAELSGLFHVAGSVHLRGRGEVALHLDLVDSAVARRAFALLRAFDVDSEIRTYRQHAFDRATRYQLHVEGDAARLRDAAPGGRARRRAPAARAAAAARRSRAAAAAARTSAGRCSAPAR